MSGRDGATIFEASERRRNPQRTRKLGAVRRGQNGHGGRRVDDAGFTAPEAGTYMRLLLEKEDSAGERLRALNRKRGKTLDGIRFRERQLERLDDLRHELRKQPARSAPDISPRKKGSSV